MDQRNHFFSTSQAQFTDYQHCQQVSQTFSQLPGVPTSGDGVRYFKQVLFTNNADGIDGQLVALPQSEVTWAAVYARVSKVGQFMIVSDETLSDEPATSPESVALSKELLKRGFKFVGPATMYAAMQSLGLVNDHLATCFARD